MPDKQPPDKARKDPREDKRPLTVQGEFIREEPGPARASKQTPPAQEKSAAQRGKPRTGR
ncbi:hypothetical protein D7Y13_06185 [Corallococcus praedator]|uniref:Uncharacterized protein n=1 Tax=Corallococcus praedator TaxID=2316724 RepID=A0ABX9QP29_9BACT|nr:hypothetical protein D7X75_10125 [Corallococcus sp. CA031C]RKI14311.1 hypothetical protein D7Y13_06185 [Corallococcus praedator]